MSTLLLYTLSCCCVSEWSALKSQRRKKRPQAETFAAGKSSFNITCKRTRTLASSFFNAQWLHPCVCIAPHLVSGFSRSKSIMRSPCTEHLNMYTFTIFTHIQRAIINQPECSRGFMFGFGLESSFAWEALQWRLLQILEGPKKKKKRWFFL